MISYSLYLESGPKHKTTMVHVLDLLGCITRGPTTEAALQATPMEIRRFLKVLHRHGERYVSMGDFKVNVVEHITKGSWVGYGDPTQGFSWDFKPLVLEEQARYLQRLDWLQAELLEPVRNLPFDLIMEKPETGERSVYQILEHVAESQVVYLRYLVGKVPAVAEAYKQISGSPIEFLFPLLEDLWHTCRVRLEGFTEEERRLQVQHGQVLWTTRRAFRRMLEHAWEHVREISDRLKLPEEV